MPRINSNNYNGAPIPLESKQNRERVFALFCPYLKLTVYYSQASAEIYYKVSKAKTPRMRFFNTMPRIDSNNNSCVSTSLLFKQSRRAALYQP